MLSIHGGKKRNSKKNSSYRMRYGGYKLSDAAAFNGGVATMPDANFAKIPTIPPSSTQVGGAYGYASGGEAATFGGSYAAPAAICTGANLDPSRGGNNFMSGGRKRRGAKRSSAKRTKRTKRTKRSTTKRGGTKRRAKKCGGKKWSQKGCRKMSGGIPLVL